MYASRQGNPFFICNLMLEGWTILNFLEQMKFGEGAEDVANLFETDSQIFSEELDLLEVPICCSEALEGFHIYVST